MFSSGEKPYSCTPKAEKYFGEEIKSFLKYIVRIEEILKGGPDSTKEDLPVHVILSIKEDDDSIQILRAVIPTEKSAIIEFDVIPMRKDYNISEYFHPSTHFFVPE